ncbi:EamA family transporter [Spongiactinospora rosea]|uniref:EamA family transporter n=1 Tax=Spongiactinospora rosea TaxID=2248750 RepID=A0A366LKL8_9ACTN|nr:DMT family transporter [Spongiactinospora rosea]RBQ14475.1 EamA family transporter [Spongiactinospora rosea]
MRNESSATVTATIAVGGPPGHAAWRGTALAALGVLAFSGTLPATGFALRGFDPYLVGVGRAVGAGLIALACLLARRAPLLPPRRELPGYAVIAAGIVFGFPVFSALAMGLGASSSHGAVVIGLLPATTAAVAFLRAGERPKLRFWIACGAGAVVVTAFTLHGGGGHITLADLLLLAALLAAAAGYTEGGRMSRRTPGWRVVSYALVLSLPLTIPLTAVLAVVTEVRPDGAALAGFAYVTVVSMFLGFIPWYAGLAAGGIARAGQVQLIQPSLTLIWSWWLLAEPVGVVTVAGALAVLACVAITQHSRA